MLGIEAIDGVPEMLGVYDTWWLAGCPFMLEAYP
jgi:hypothetical protein